MQLCNETQQEDREYREAVMYIKHVYQPPCVSMSAAPQKF